MENIKKRETSSIFEFDDRTFVINAYDPMTGNYLLMQCLSLVLPFGIGDMLNSVVGSGSSSIGGSNKIMSKTEFMQFQTDILSTVYEKYPSGNTSPVVRKDGTYGTTDVTMAMLVKLLVASLAFNFKDFFKEGQSIKDLMEGNLSSLASL